MNTIQQTAKPRESVRAENLVAKYNAIGPAAILAAVLSTVRKRPQLKLASIVQETD
ncbi:hypothetical protein SAMN05428967_2490 [Phyllobacterium sp. YR620]|jgi:hypothetical protein|uniref:Uncharacterized protein n=1 Tax=Phyllobacterium pellucidum TaxID=2740464 RepID=A0A849VJX0_9HYPH|nr:MULTISPECIES: hypothetical protein [Phyllobacterium]NTS30052.1 hypothetical protein [Phyllobacterium pellucidum]UGY08140.1 hypothetical protein LLE51_008640 [Phyllobacterium sp. T1018]SDP56548.1 hypothetical protein SAMN05428967_2490 [Phyllobacterium sp. YR620]SFI49942.1 hypothetical protein SAMN04515648_0173 [Phyllobacterium sp. CL33Tsu]